MILPEQVALGPDADADGLVLSSGPSFGLVYLRLMFFAGAGAEGGMAGGAHLVLSMTDRGTQHRARLEYNEALERLGAELAWNVGRSTTVLTLRVLEPELDAALLLLLEALTEPADFEDEYRTLRREIAEDVDCALEEPGGVASRLLTPALWPDSAWGLPIDGTRRTRGRVTLAGLERRRAELFGSRLLVGIGADAPDRVAPAVRGFVAALRARWPRRTSTQTARPQPLWAPGYAAAFDDAEQGALYVAAEAPEPYGESWAAVTLHHAGFTASFNSPLMRAVRGDEGLSYEVSSALLPELGGSMHLFSSQPRGDAAAYVVKRAMEAWQRYVDAPGDAAAREQIVRHLAGSHRVALETVRQRLAYAMQLLRLGGDVRWMIDLPSRLAAVSQSEFESAGSLWGWSRRWTMLAVVPQGASSPQWSDFGREVLPIAVASVV